MGRAWGHLKQLSRMHLRFCRESLKYPPGSGRAWIRRISVADPHDRFLEKFTRAQPVLRRFVLAHVPDFHQAEDVLQQIALVLWRKFPEFKPGMAFEHWAFGVARREVLHTRRTSARLRQVLSGEVAEEFEEQLQASAPQFDERSVFVDECLRKLPERMRAAVEQKYSAGLSSEKTATSLGLTVNALRIMLCRARQAIDECLRKSLQQGAGAGGGS